MSAYFEHVAIYTYIMYICSLLAGLRDQHSDAACATCPPTLSTSRCSDVSSVLPRSRRSASPPASRCRRTRSRRGCRRRRSRSTSSSSTGGFRPRPPVRCSRRPLTVRRACRFYMAMREKYTKPGESIHYYLVEWDPAKLSWGDFREKILGATDPGTGAAAAARAASAPRVPGSPAPRAAQLRTARCARPSSRAGRASASRASRTSATTACTRRRARLRRRTRDDTIGTGHRILHPG